jgi:hypothetical protein
MTRKYVIQNAMKPIKKYFVDKSKHRGLAHFRKIYDEHHENIFVSLEDIIGETCNKKINELDYDAINDTEIDSCEEIEIDIVDDSTSIDTETDTESESNEGVNEAEIMKIVFGGDDIDEDVIVDEEEIWEIVNEI